MDTRLERIRKKLEQARAEGRPYTRRETKDAYALNPTMPEETLTEFEAKQGVRLPDAYREFLLRFSDGGPGPGEGLFRQWRRLTEPRESPIYPEEDLAAPCLLHPGLSEAYDWEEQLGCDSCDCYQGTLSIAQVRLPLHDEARIIVSGPYRGRIVYVDTTALGKPPIFMPDPDFLAWYERWLDELLAGHDVTEFGRGLAGGEEDFLAALHAGGEPCWRVEAVWAMGRLPHPSETAVEAIIACLMEEAPALRRTAAQTLGKLAIPRTASPLRDTLSDSDPRVRRAALRALFALPSIDCREDARRMLRDTDSGVVTDAVYHLKDVGRLTLEDVAPLLDSEDPLIRLPAAIGIGEARVKEAVPRLHAMLHDPAPGVRQAVVYALWTIGSTASIGVLRELQATEEHWEVRGTLKSALLALRLRKWWPF